MSEFNRQALDPANNIVIDACAGSGKTWLLVSRIIRLLLEGVAPGEILAITFTRKAQQEMAWRLREWLRYMALAPEADLRQFLADRAVDAAAIDRLLPQARRLFEQFLAADPAMTIQTFHGWFLQLLQRVPLPGGWVGEQAVAEQTSPLVEEAWMHFAEALHAVPGSAHAVALERLYRQYGPSNIQRLLRDFVARRAEWWAYTRGQADPVGYALQVLAAEFGVAGDSAETRLLQDPVFRQDMQEYAGLLTQNTASDQQTAAHLLQALRDTAATAPFEQLHAALCTAQNTPRVRRESAAQAKRLGTAGEQRLLALHDALCQRLAAAFLARQDAAAYQLNEAALPLGHALLQHYQQVKQAHQLVDFTDIEWQASTLLNHSDYAEYMQYKLDSRYRHILLDEFQDTNPLQWQVLAAWLQAADAAQMRPGIFLVGDPKQSIYRFRRAEPRLFQRAADYLVQAYAAIRLSQDESRRCAPAILEAVNRTFASGYAGFLPHSAYHRQLWGRVELLPLAAQGAAASDAAPAPATDLRYLREGQALAAQLQAIVGHWLVTDENGRCRPAQYQDILLLVRTRAHLETYEQALRAAAIPYVSSRQGGLLEALECRDLTALLTFLITPFDRLSLAHALRTPLFAATEADLLLLAQCDGDSWLARLGAVARQNACLGRAWTLLSRWRALADTRPVHDLLDCIYAEGEVLQRYRAAVPAARAAAVVENLLAFMELSLTIEAGRYPSLARFLDALAQLRRAPPEETPNEGVLGEAGNAVRILTIHAAKGLEAPITWLLDAHQAAVPEQDYRVLVDWPPESDRPRHFSLCGRPQERGAARAAYFQVEAQQAAREAQNLLYVAMTRARQVLLLSGVEQRRSSSSMYDAVRQALGAADATGRVVLGGAPDLAADRPSAAAVTALPVLSPGLTSPPAGCRQVQEGRFGRRYSAGLQAVLERLQQGGAVDWRTLQCRLRLDAQTFAGMVAQAQALLANPDLARFYDASCYQRARNGLAYQAFGGEAQAVDRLVEFNDAVWVLGYSGYTEGEEDAQARLAAGAQLLQHCQALQPLFAGKHMHAALVLASGQWWPVMPRD